MIRLDVWLQPVYTGTMNSTDTMSDAEIIAEQRAKRDRKNRSLNRDYVVTVTQEHFVNVKAKNKREAEKKALIAIDNRWGGGRNPKITEVERLP